MDQSNSPYGKLWCLLGAGLKHVWNMSSLGHVILKKRTTNLINCIVKTFITRAGFQFRVVGSNYARSCERENFENRLHTTQRFVGFILLRVRSAFSHTCIVTVSIEPTIMADGELTSARINVASSSSVRVRTQPEFGITVANTRNPIKASATASEAEIENRKIRNLSINIAKSSESLV